MTLVCTFVAIVASGPLSPIEVIETEKGVEVYTASPARFPKPVMRPGGVVRQFMPGLKNVRFKRRLASGPIKKVVAQSKPRGSYIYFVPKAGEVLSLSNVTHHTSPTRIRYTYPGGVPVAAEAVPKPRSEPTSLDSSEGVELESPARESDVVSYFPLSSRQFFALAGLALGIVLIGLWSLLRSRNRASRLPKELNVVAEKRLSAKAHLYLVQFGTSQWLLCVGPRGVELLSDGVVERVEAAEVTERSTGTAASYPEDLRDISGVFELKRRRSKPGQLKAIA